MDVKVLLSIYNKPWLIEPSAAMQMLDMWERVKADGAKWSYRPKAEDGETPLSTYQIHQKFFASEQVMLAPTSSWDMEDFKGFDGASIAIIPVSGPLMKSDYCGSFGTNTLRYLTQMANNAASVHTILFLVDSPGGTVDGTQSFADTIKSSPKRTIALCDGMMCSAAYWIGSSADEVYAASKTDVIGSIGTMCSFYDSSEYLKKNGIVLREYYATDSTDKNKAFTEAKKGDGKKLISEMLDPLNDVFMGTVKENRNGKIGKKENVLTGKTYTAEKAIAAGLIDGVSSFEDIVIEALEAKGAKKQKATTLTFSTSNTMTLADFKSEYPDIHTEAIAAGAADERARIQSWLEWNDVDPEGVAEGISQGKEMTKSVVSAMSSKAAAKQKLDNINTDSPGAVNTPVAGVAKTVEQTQLEANQTELKQLLNIKD